MISRWLRVSRGKKGGGERDHLKFNHFAIVLAIVRGGTIGLYGDLFVKTSHRARKFAAFGLIDGSVIWGVFAWLWIYLGLAHWVKMTICIALWFDLFKNTLFAISINTKYAYVLFFSSISW